MEQLKDIKTQPVDGGRMAFLKSRWTITHEKLNEYLNKLVPNTAIVANPFENEEKMYKVVFNLIINNNAEIFVNEKRNLMIMSQSGCHNNVPLLVKNKKIDKHYIGYGLSKDGLWRLHSWGMKSGEIIETTENREVYVGVCVSTTNSYPNVSDTIADHIKTINDKGEQLAYTTIMKYLIRIDEDCDQEYD